MLFSGLMCTIFNCKASIASNNQLNKSNLALSPNTSMICLIVGSPTKSRYIPVATLEKDKLGLSCAKLRIKLVCLLRLA